MITFYVEAQDEQYTIMAEQEEQNVHSGQKKKENYLCMNSSAAW